MKVHNNDLARYTPALPESAQEALSDSSKNCLKNLLRYQVAPMPELGEVRQAAVLVILFRLPASGDLSVLLTTRSKSLRRHPSQTALPGGKVDTNDLTIQHTARREAFEEIGLPLDSCHIHHITTMDPIISILPLNALMRNHIIVHPVVCFVSDDSVIRDLQPAPTEVDRIFAYPLRGCKEGVVDDQDAKNLVEPRSEHWPYDQDFHSTEFRIGLTGPYAMHCFRTVHTPIKGLTSDVLIDLATVAYGTVPTFERFAPGQTSFRQVISQVVYELPRSLEAEAARFRTGMHMVGQPMGWALMRSGETVRSVEQWQDKAE